MKTADNYQGKHFFTQNLIYKYIHFFISGKLLIQAIFGRLLPSKVANKEQAKLEAKNLIDNLLIKAGEDLSIHNLTKIISLYLTSKYNLCSFPKVETQVVGSLFLLLS